MNAPKTHRESQQSAEEEPQLTGLLKGGPSTVASGPLAVNRLALVAMTCPPGKGAEEPLFLSGRMLPIASPHTEGPLGRGRGSSGRCPRITEPVEEGAPKKAVCLRFKSRLIGGCKVTGRSSDTAGVGFLLVGWLSV